MMKVPKAGRPLAKCPHPKGTCSCQKTYALMVRIPKGEFHAMKQFLPWTQVDKRFSGSTCLCRPLYKIPVASTENGQSPPTSAAPASSPLPGKIQKPSRRQSTLQAAPENIARALDFAPEFSNQQANNGVSTPGTPYSFQYSPFTSSGTPTSSHKPPMILPKQTPETSVRTEARKGSCCSREQKPIQPAEKKRSCCGNTTPEVQEEQEQKSCCSSKPMGVATSATDPSEPFSSWQNFTFSGNHLARQNLPFSQPYLHDPVYLNGFQVPNSAPATPISFASSNTQWGPSVFGPSVQQLFPAGSVSYGADASKHECSCGDDCQCLGCASHPFNNTTRQHILEMGYMMTIGEGGESPDALDGSRTTPVSGPMSPPLFGYPAATQTATTVGGSCCGQTAHEQRRPSNFDYELPTPNPTHYNSGHLMQPSEYYEVEYPVPLPDACSDMTGTCQCDSDCNCVGCLTHSGHNGMPLEDPPESTNAGVEEYSALSQQPSHPEGRRFSTLEEFSFSSLSPPAIEPQLV